MKTVLEETPAGPVPSRPVAEIVSQGDEVLSGQTVDTNAAWLGVELTALGFDVRYHVTVGDCHDDIRAVIETAFVRSDVCICSGGLGPTDDDLTAAAVAAAAGVELCFDAEAMAQIEALYQRFRKPMPDSNRKQAWLPDGATRLDNRWGTAPGFVVSSGRCCLACVPGVPREMRKIYRHHLVALLSQRFGLQAGRLVTLRTAGIGESRLQQLIGPWQEPGVSLSYRTMAPENQVKLRFAPEVDAARADALTTELATRIGAPVFAIQGNADAADDLPRVAMSMLAEQDLTLAVAEYGSGASLTAMLHCGREEQRLLASSVAPRRAGSIDTALLAATEARQRSGASLGLALLMCADTGSTEAGSGEVALVGDGLSISRPLQVAGGRQLIRTLAAGAAIDLLRRQLAIWSAL